MPLKSDSEPIGSWIGIAFGVSRSMIELETFLEARAGTVKFVDEADARHFVVVRITPVRFGLRFHAGNAVKNDDRAVENAQRALHLDRKVDVARRVDQVDLMFEFLVAIK